MEQVMANGNGNGNGTTRIGLGEAALASTVESNAEKVRELEALLGDETESFSNTSELTDAGDYSARFGKAGEYSAYADLRGKGDTHTEARIDLLRKLPGTAQLPSVWKEILDLNYRADHLGERVYLSIPARLEGLEQASKVSNVAIGTAIGGLLFLAYRFMKTQKEQQPAPAR
jgi:hypothetical protein